MTLTTYNRYLAPATVIEISGGATRTTTTTYDAAERTLTTAVAAQGLAGSVPVKTTRTDYDPATGLATGTDSLNADGSVSSTVSTGYDLWGRQTVYTDSDGQETTTTYDTAGRVATTTDPTGTTTNTYDSATDHRGLLTSQTVTGVGTYSASYDAAGDLTTQTLPGGLTQTTGYDQAGNQVSLDYAMPTTGGAMTGVALWTLTRNSGGAIDQVSGPSSSGGERDTTYAYDLADRLTSVGDTVDGACTTRAYTFDQNGNRTALATATHDGDCTTGTTTTAAKAWTYDGADRVQTGANTQGTYTYDAFGRQTSIPAADTTHAAADAVAVGYFDSDLAASTSQGGATTTYTLDPAGRRSTQSTTTSGATTSVVRHYADTSDNPAWATTTAGGVTSTTRYVGSIGGDLGATVTDGALSLQVADPLGNTSTTLTVDGTTLTPSGLATNDEYGTQQGGTAPTTGAITYGWEGAKERAQDAATTLILMGARLYNTLTGLFTSTDPTPGGNTTDYTYPQDPINRNDLDGNRWNWRRIGRAAFIVGGIVGALACGASIICGAAVGAAASAGAYWLNGRRHNKAGWAQAVAGGGLSGAAFGGVGRALGTAMKYARAGVTFTRGPGRGTNFIWRSRRVFSIHSHSIPGRRWIQAPVHYHARWGGSGIRWHRPWDISGRTGGRIW